MNSSDNSKSAPTETSAAISEGLPHLFFGGFQLPVRSLDICFIFVLLITIFYFLQWPISAFDTDLWTHLNGGRYLVEHGKLPETSFYSFVSPQREIISYSWLFKAFVFQVFRFFGYYGLIILRTLVCTASLAIIYVILRSRRSEIGAAAFFVLYFLLFIDSGEGIRPYSFSYLFILIFLYVLEHRPRQAYLLPPAAIVWINFHGIEYPVMLLIVGCYLAAYFLNRRQQGLTSERHNYRLLVPLVLCIAAVFASPYGGRLLPVPFTDTAYASDYISELRKIALGDLLHFRLVGLAPDFASVSNVLIFANAAVVLVRLSRRQILLHHLVLFAGGCFLLTRGMRFVHEFALLSLPALTVIAGDQSKERGPVRWKPAAVVVTILLLLVSLVYVNNLYGNRPKYPVTRANLPIGVTAFLQHVGARGRILNDPVTGGYLSWRMWPDCLIYMDMQVPFLFTNGDYFLGSNAIYNPQVFQSFLGRYEPDYLSLPIRAPLNTKPVIRDAGYVPVFFDDREILYVYQARHRAMAERHQLKIINPAAGDRIDFRRMSVPEKERFLGEAQRLIRIYPQGLTVNRLLALYFTEQKEFQRAIEHAERIIHNFPNHAEGYLRKAAVLNQIQSYAEALKFYRRALIRTEKQQRKELHQAVAQCYFGLQQYRKAYASLIKSGNFFLPSVGYLDLYRLALTAYQVGKLDEARMLAQFAALKQPAQSGRRDPRVEKLIRALKKDTQ